MKTILLAVAIVAAPFVGFSTAKAIDKAQFAQPTTETSANKLEWPHTPQAHLPLAAQKK